MRQRKSKKFLLYFFLLIIISSIHSSELNKIKLDKIDNINISGLSYENKNILLREIKNLNLQNIFMINVYELKKIINNNTLIERYKIFKKYPSSLKIDIQKTTFLAKINNNNKIFLVGSNGKFTNAKLYDQDLPFIFGKPDIKEFLEFKKIIDRSKISYDQVENIYYFQSGRWDLKLKKNIYLKLPKNNLNISLDNAFEFISYNNIIENKIIDLRVTNQIIVNG